MARAPRTLRMRRDDEQFDEVVAAMGAMSEARRGWLNTTPVPEIPLPPLRGERIARAFSGRGPHLPVCTWVARQDGQKPPHEELGILHRAGPKAVAQLADDGCPVPDRWVVLADHPKRGLVIAVHPDTAHDVSLRWLLDAAVRLCNIRLNGWWQTSIHDG